MSELSKHLGLAYIPGRQDCFSLCRNVLRERWDIRLPNFARPTNFWEDPSLDLYKMYARFGFEAVFDKPFEIGDILLMPLGTRVNSHAAMVVEKNQILHHPPGVLSTLDPLMPKWSRRANVVLRNPLVKEKQPKSKIHISEVLDAEIFRHPEVKKRIDRALEAERRGVRGDNPKEETGSEDQSGG